MSAHIGSALLSGTGGRILEVMKPRSAAQRRHLPNSPFKVQAEPTIEQFAVNDRVSHDKYGLGRVVSREDAAVIVDFGANQVRIASPFHKLTKL
jgi:hypothetical protein